MLSRCLEALKMLQGHGVDLVAVIGSYLVRGIVSLLRRSLRLFEMTAEGSPFVGTVTAGPLPYVGEV